MAVTINDIKKAQGKLIKAGWEPVAAFDYLKQNPGEVAAILWDKKIISKPNQTPPAEEVTQLTEEERNTLPESVPEDIQRYITEFCNRFSIDDMRKASASAWGACCLYIGENIKKTGVLRDRERERREGGRIYNPERVAAMLPLWAMLCGGFEKAPLSGDFIHFCGVSSSWFLDCNGHCDLTSSGGKLYEKLLEIQEIGVSAVLVDGRRNPTGAIFFLKNWHGWKDSREVIHRDTGRTDTADALPVFDASGGFLPCQEPGESE